MMKTPISTLRNSFLHITALLLVSGATGLAHGQPGPEPKWFSLDEGQIVASQEGKMLFIFFEAEWCAICKRMKKETFPDAEVLSLLESRFVPVSVDLDSRETVFFNEEEYTERSFAQAMEVVATPTMTFADHKGRILGETSGFYDRTRFLALLSYLDSDVFDELTFEEYEARLEEDK